MSLCLIVSGEFKIGLNRLQVLKGRKKKHGAKKNPYIYSINILLVKGFRGGYKYCIQGYFRPSSVGNGFAPS